ncbi:hypothetical protein B0H19DRAFT_1263090 [Mycena capillaripes]|nr:hypothetical protein B0H19DRAFT_1263090 [Mycena capillaripes]
MLLSAALLLSATGTMATHSARGHSGLAQRLTPSNTSALEGLERRDQFVGVPMTWYPTDTGADACTGKNHLDSDWYVAMNYNQFGDGSACCGKQLRINYNGKSTVATCVDECATCDVWGSIDLTKGLFTYLVGSGGPDVGEFWGSWSFVDGNDDPPPPPPKKTTTTTSHHTSTHTSTHTTTSTTHTSTSMHVSALVHSSSSSHASSSSIHRSSSPSHSASASHTSASASATPSPSAPPSADNIAHFSEAMLGLMGLVVQGAGAQ